jgi:hypothetical protein
VNFQFGLCDFSKVVIFIVKGLWFGFLSLMSFVWGGIISSELLSGVVCNFYQGVIFFIVDE